MLRFMSFRPSFSGLQTQKKGGPLVSLVPSARRFSSTPSTEGIPSRRLVENAQAAFNESELAYHKMKVDDISFQVQTQTRTQRTDGTGTFFPVLLYQDKVQKNGLEHVVPWATVSKAKLGYTGDLGEKNYSTGKSKKTPSELRTTVSLCVTGRHEEEAGNKDLLMYFDWMLEINQKFVQFVHDHLDAFPKLEAKYQNDKADPQTLYDLLTADALPVVRTIRIEDQPMSGTEYIAASTRMFYKAKNPPKKFYSEWDQEIYDVFKLVRLHVPVYDSQSKPLPPTIRPVLPGDVVSCTFMLRALVWDQLFGVKNDIKNVTLLCRNPGVEDLLEIYDDEN
eukprot:comp22249_c0_seq1/m.32854 comp22249_c0_seq1/g.32854  ORF comp22249_c0_seq1/g.32854 comp22249_c0_seq1/m.32854 type:complete len:336 (-) comp22249_c0_seq1:343-1350(-)